MKYLRENWSKNKWIIANLHEINKDGRHLAIRFARIFQIDRKCGGHPEGSPANEVEAGHGQRVQGNAQQRDLGTNLGGLEKEK